MSIDAYAAERDDDSLWRKAADRAYNSGYQAHEAGRGCHPPAGPHSDAWESGWLAAEMTRDGR